MRRLPRCAKLRSWLASFDGFVGANKERFWDCEPESFRCFEVDDQLKRSRLLDRDVGNLDAVEELDELLGHYLNEELTEARPVGGKAAFLRRFRPFIDRRQAQRRGP